jgi:hypothetical protein
LVGKRAEMHLLFAKIRSVSYSSLAAEARESGLRRTGTRPRGWTALDIGDSEYEEGFSMELLEVLVSGDDRPGFRDGNKVICGELRYLGTLVLPVGGKEVSPLCSCSGIPRLICLLQRLKFYSLLRRLPSLGCIEVEITEWSPQPSTLPAFRALGSEMRLYCPTVTRVVFLADFERTVLEFVDTGGACVWKIDEEAVPEEMWREVC